ncbi:hypothetical protein LJC23_03370 [Desulfovibrio sp. OttesenSCG-928-I05]|nr:hypothetical protein [Desulfovibrio sp. OttesenSCG-928-I05]
MDTRRITTYINDISELLTTTTDAIWDYAETAFEEFKSVALLKKILAENGFSLTERIGGIDTAFAASYGEGAPHIGILAEYDALSAMSQKPGTPVREEAVPGGNGHGCGHNLFAGASLGAALALARFSVQTLRVLAPVRRMG